MVVEQRINKIKTIMYSKFASLTAIEPGLGRRLTQPLIEIISRFLEKEHVYFSNVFLIFDHCNYTLYFTMCDSQYNLILYMRDLGEDYIHSWLFIL